MLRLFLSLILIILGAAAAAQQPLQPQTVAYEADAQAQDRQEDPAQAQISDRARTVRGGARARPLTA